MQGGSEGKPFADTPKNLPLSNAGSYEHLGQLSATEGGHNVSCCWTLNCLTIIFYLMPYQINIIQISKMQELYMLLQEASLVYFIDLKRRLKQA